MGTSQVLISLLILGCLTAFVTSSPIKGGKSSSSSRPSNIFRVKGNGQTKVEQPSWVKQPTVTRQDDQATTPLGSADQEWSQRDQQDHAASHDSQHQQSHDQDSFDHQSGHHSGPQATTPTPAVTFGSQSMSSSFGVRISQAGRDSQASSKCSAKGSCKTTNLDTKSDSPRFPSDSFGPTTTVSSFGEDSGSFQQHEEVQNGFGQHSIHSMFPGPPRETVPDQYDEPQQNQFFGSDDYVVSAGQSQDDSGHIEGLLHPDHDSRPQFDSRVKGSTGFSGAGAGIQGVGDQQPIQGVGSQQPAQSVGGQQTIQNEGFQQPIQTTGFQRPVQHEDSQHRVKGETAEQSAAGVQQPFEAVSFPQSIQDAGIQQQSAFDDQSRTSSSGHPDQMSFGPQVPDSQTQTGYQSSSQISGSSGGQSFTGFPPRGQSSVKGYSGGQYHDDGQYQYYANPLDGLRYNVPGNPGEDYPILYQVPETSFSCQQQAFSAGIYGDMEASCQVFHVCKDDGGQDSFLCPNGTVFNQQYFVCDWWYNYRCSDTPSFYGLNAELYWDFDRFTPSQVLNVPMNINEQSKGDAGTIDTFSGSGRDVGAIDTFSGSGRDTSAIDTFSGTGRDTSAIDTFSGSGRGVKTSQHDSKQFEQRMDGHSFDADRTTVSNSQSNDFHQQRQVFASSQPAQTHVNRAQSKISSPGKTSSVPAANDFSSQHASSDSRNSQQPDSNAGTRYPGQGQGAQNVNVFQQQNVPQTSFGSNSSPGMDRLDEQQLLQSVPFVEESPNTFTNAREPDEIENGQQDKNTVPFGFNQQTQPESAVNGADRGQQNQQHGVSKPFDDQTGFTSGGSFGTKTVGGHLADFGEAGQFADQEHISVPFNDQVKTAAGQTPVVEQQQQIAPFDSSSHDDHHKSISSDSQFQDQSQESFDDASQNFVANEDVQNQQANDSPLDGNQFMQQEFVSNSFDGQTAPGVFQGFDAITEDPSGFQQVGQDDSSFEAPVQALNDGDRRSNELDSQSVQKVLDNPQFQQEFVSTDFDSFDQQQHDAAANNVGAEGGFPGSQEQIATNDDRQTDDRHSVQSQVPFSDNQQDILRNVNQNEHGLQQNNEGPAVGKTRHPGSHSQDGQQGQTINQDRIPVDFDNRQPDSKKQNNFVPGDNSEVQQQRQPFNEFPAGNQGHHHQGNKAEGDWSRQEQFQVSNQGDQRPNRQRMNFRPYGQNPQQNPNNYLPDENQDQHLRPEDQQRKISEHSGNEDQRPPHHQQVNFRPYGQNPQQNPNNYQPDENQDQHLRPDDQQRKISENFDIEDQRPNHQRVNFRPYGQNPQQNPNNYQPDANQDQHLRPEDQQQKISENFGSEDQRPNHQRVNFRPYGQNPQQNPNNHRPEDQQRKVSVYSNNGGPSNRNFFVTNGHQVREQRPGQFNQRRINLPQEQPRQYANQGPYIQQEYQLTAFDQPQLEHQRPQPSAYDQPQQEIQQRPQQYAGPHSQGPVYQNEVHRDQYPEQRNIEYVQFPGAYEGADSDTQYSAQGRSLYVKADEAKQVYSSPEQAAAAKSYNGWRPIVKN